MAMIDINCDMGEGFGVYALGGVWLVNHLDNTPLRVPSWLQAQQTSPAPSQPSQTPSPPPNQQSSGPASAPQNQPAPQNETQKQ